MSTIFLFQTQESPPAWTQEAYRPRRIKYSTRGGVSPSPPPARCDRGYPRWGTPSRGTPWPGLRGVPGVGYPLTRGSPQPGPMGGTWGGVPPSQVWQGRGYPRWGPLAGVPWSGLTVGYPRWGTPRPGPTVEYMGWGTPLPGVPPARSKGGYPRWGTPWQGYPLLDLAGVPPLCVDRQNDGQTCVKTLPSRRTTYAVGNKAYFLHRALNVILPALVDVGYMLELTHVLKSLKWQTF